MTLYSNICAVLAEASDDIEEKMHLQQESLDAGVKSGHSWAAMLSARWLGHEYLGLGEVQKVMDAWEQGWRMGVRARHVCGYFFTKHTRDLMLLYQSEGERNKILDMMLEMVDSTLFLHGKPRSHPTIQHRWNDTVEETLKALHSMDPEIYGELKRSLELRLSDTDAAGEQFFYHSQLAILAMLRCDRGSTEAHLHEMLRLLPSAGTYSQRISRRTHCLMELMGTSSEQRRSAIEGMVETTREFPHLQYVVDAVKCLVSDEAVAQLMDLDHVKHLALEHIKAPRPGHTVQSFLRVGRMYSNYGDPDALKELAEEVQTTMPDTLCEEGTVQLLLEPVQLLGTQRTEIVEDFSQDPTTSGWDWVDPAGDCSYGWKDGSYLQIAVPPVHSLGDLWFGANLNAPRLLRLLSGDFAVETKLSDGFAGKGVGGLLVWADDRNFARLELAPSGISTSVWYAGSVYYGAIADGKFIHPGVHLFEAEPAWLRLERKEDRFTGYVSSDGENWYRVGWADIPMQDPIQVGIHALCLQSSATSTRFQYFRIYRPEE
jgi:regulation of enolase protein 1 (concanavalin A-like superfamily)